MLLFCISYPKIFNFIYVCGKQENQRKEKYKQLEKQLKKSEETQVSYSDPESRRIMNIVGKDELKKYLEVLILLILAIYFHKWAKLSRSDISIFFNKIVTSFFKVTLNRLIFV